MLCRLIRIHRLCNIKTLRCNQIKPIRERILNNLHCAETHCNRSLLPNVRKNGGLAILGYVMSHFKISECTYSLLNDVCKLERINESLNERSSCTLRTAISNLRLVLNSVMKRACMRIQGWNLEEESRSKSAMRVSFVE